MKAATKIHFLFLRIHTISIHAAREGGDSKLYIINFQFFGFQSTPPVKAATNTNAESNISGIISIHAAREGGDCQKSPFFSIVTISIHAAREGGDHSAWAVVFSPALFQSTPPVKAATTHYDAHIGHQRISIHAAREGGDTQRENVP